MAIFHKRVIYSRQLDCVFSETFTNGKQVSKMFEINVFGLGRMIKAVLPGMRAHRSGVIVSFSSLVGRIAFPSLGYYSATKFAVEGLSEALRQETAPLGVKVMVAEPSGFRTDWAGRSADESKAQIADYKDTASAVIDVVLSGAGPHHRLPGADFPKAA